jgi:GTP:adenosylcobinamide-phosphate guanylyltransferase
MEYIEDVRFSMEYIEDVRFSMEYIEDVRFSMEYIEDVRFIHTLNLSILYGRSNALEKILDLL